MKETLGYFLDESVILSNDFFDFFEKHSEKGKFYCDDQLMTRIQDLQQVGRYVESYTLMCFFGLIQASKNVETITTKNLFEFSQIEIVAGKLKSFYFLTQNDALLRRIPGPLLKKDGFKAARLHLGQLKAYEFNDQQQKTFKRAYFLDHDPYIKPIKDNLILAVYSPKLGYLPLDKKDSYSGGEGNLYRTHHEWLVKIYNEKHQTYPNLKKLQRMLEMDIYDDRIIWPKDIVFYQGQFVGYVMKAVPKATPLSEIFNTGILPFASSHPYYRVTAALNILDAIHYLHQKNILIGDLKDDNILIRNEEEIFIVDTGSFQLEDYASNVLTRGWVDNNLNSNFDAKKNLRTVDDEYYPINRLAFELLTTKNPHYNPKDTELNIGNTEGFHFPLTPKISQNSGKTMLYWGSISQRLRDYFYYYFENADNRKITYLEELILELKNEQSKFLSVLKRG
jgi:serine/threonine protein kinase